jgi:two-component system, cell cycle sensor histidine kinase and response regulator CckA
MKKYFDRLFFKYESEDWLIQQKAKALAYINIFLISGSLIDAIGSSTVLGHLSPTIYTDILAVIFLSYSINLIARGNILGAVNVTIGISITLMTIIRFISTGHFSSDASYDLVQYSLDLILVIFYVNLIAFRAIQIIITFIVSFVLITIYAFHFQNIFQTPITKATDSVIISNYIFLGVAGLIALFTFLTNRKAIDIAKLESQTSKENERMLGAIFNSSVHFIGLLDIDGKILKANQSALDFARIHEIDVINKPFWETIWWAHSPEMKEKVRDAIKKASTGEFIRFEATHLSAEGRIHIIDFTLKPVMDETGKIFSLIPEGRDITDTKQAEEMLRKSESQYRILFEGANDAILIMNGEKFIECNKMTLNIFGCEKIEDIIGHSPWEFSPEYQPSGIKSIEEASRLISNALDGISQRFNWKHCRKNGLLFDAEVSLNKVALGEGVFLQAIVRDVTERKLAEEKIIEQARLLDVARDSIIVRDMNDQLQYINKATEELFGWTFDEMRHLKTAELVSEKDLDKFEEGKKFCMQKGEFEGEFIARTKRGQEILISSRWSIVRGKSGIPSARFIINRNITEQRRLETQFRRIQRLESLGTLAGGIAHDLNNVLSPIMMSINLLSENISDPRLKKILSSLETSTQRGSDIVKQVLAFARGTEGEFVPQQVRYIVREIQSIVKETFPRNILFHSNIPKEIKPVLGDTTQLHQVLLNLCINARDAMPSGGHLNIEAENVRLDSSAGKIHPDAIPGDYIVLSISDTGIGIPKENQEKIFEPFFTTKDFGKGTGLGLSTIYTIVKVHKGFITLKSELGKGAEFKVFLPAIDGNEQYTVNVHEKILPSGNNELILLIDDERSVLEITKETLESYNYRVITARDGTEALALLQSRNIISIDLVLTDINMPVMDGPTTIRMLRKIDPAIKIILSSGVIVEVNAKKFAMLDTQAFLRKPYTTEVLLKTIREVLDK